MRELEDVIIANNQVDQSQFITVDIRTSYI